MQNTGIDKTVIKNFIVKKIDMEKLESVSNKENVMLIKNDGINYFFEKREDNFNTIIIDKDEMFNRLKISVKKVGENNITKYAYLDLSVTKKGYNNLVALGVEEYKLRLKSIFEYVEERYGIMCDVSNVKFKSVELNTTIELKEDFSKYVRAFEIMMNIAPKNYKKRNVVINHSKDKLNTMYLENDSIKVKFYDKKEQLKDVHKKDLKENYLRVEYTIKTSEKMKEVFNHNDLNLLTDEEIKSFLKQRFEADFIARYEKNKVENIKLITKLAKEMKKEKKQWLKSLIISLLNTEIETKKIICFDVEHLKEVVAKLDKKNKSRNIKRIEKEVENMSALVNQESKIMEIFNKINDVN